MQLSPVSVSTVSAEAPLTAKAAAVPSKGAQAKVVNWSALKRSEIHMEQATALFARNTADMTLRGIEETLLGAAEMRTAVSNASVQQACQQILEIGARLTTSYVRENWTLTAGPVTPVNYLKRLAFEQMHSSLSELRQFASAADQAIDRVQARHDKD